jgi:hypothetical protein
MKKQARTTRGSGALPIAAGAPREGWAAAGASFGRGGGPAPRQQACCWCLAGGSKDCKKVLKMKFHQEHPHNAICNLLCGTQCV